MIENEINLSHAISPKSTSKPFVREKKFCKCTKLLIVDDDSGIRMILKHHAMSMSIEFDEADNGYIALQKVRDKIQNDCCQFYSLILTDYYMPEVDGVKMSIQVKEMLSLYPHNPTKIVLVSGLSKEERDYICGLPNNPIEMIESKPLFKNRFIEIVNKYIL